MVISDCWAAYHDLDSQGFMHRTVNHSIHFIDPDTGDHTNTIEATWHSMKVFLGQYNRGEDYHYHLAHYMFAARRKAFHHFYNSFTSSLTQTGLSVMCHAPLPAPRDNLAVVHALLYHLLLQARVRFCRLLKRHFRYITIPPDTVPEITLSLMTVALAAILGPELCNPAN
jgi:hypothetical protein